MPTRRQPTAAHRVHLDEDAALRALVEGTVDSTGQAFFRALVRNLASILGVRGAWVTEWFPQQNRLHALAFWLDDHFVDGWTYDVANTPCCDVVRQRRLVHVPDRLMDLYPIDPDLPSLRAVSYLGAPLLSEDGQTVMGHISVLDDRQLPPATAVQTIFQLFAARAGAEHRRLRMEAALREREARMNRLLTSAMDAILELSADGIVTYANAAAARVFRHSPASLCGHPFTARLAPPCAATFTAACQSLRESDTDSLWLPEPLSAVRSDGDSFQAEATLALCAETTPPSYTLILRDINDRLAAADRIARLASETVILQRQLRQAQGFTDIIGDSLPMQALRADLMRVAPTDATVLVLGESGTGKELIAAAVHDASPRRDRPLVKVNCAALPTSLIESELFGHEKGAFTGATQARVGRFAMADGGSLFLDEIGELPLDLQAKLLRVLQEGEFEPLGGARTLHVDVRVIAATNRDLDAMVQSGAFRGDLYYRLNVFPIHIPPLRQRGDDIRLLAEAFIADCSQRLNRRPPPLHADALQRLRRYPWPGNVRELQNLIERALILSPPDRLDLGRVLPPITGPAAPGALAPAADPERILTATELLDFERENLRRALEAADWKVAGDTGAAARLGMPPSTLASRLKALGLKRPTREIS